MDPYTISIGMFTPNDSESLAVLSRPIIEGITKEFEDVAKQGIPVIFEFGVVRGGNIFATLELVELIDSYSVNTHAFARGIVASAGVYLYIACQKREADPRTQFILHPCSYDGEDIRSSWLIFPNEHIENIRRNIKLINLKSVNLLTSRTNISRERATYLVAERLEGDEPFTAQEAYDCGIVTEPVCELKPL